MKYLKIGNSDLKLSAITFGAWAAGGWMWGGTKRSDAVNAIRASINEGVTSIDTAPIYGMGISEEIVGEAIKGIPRNQLQIITKYGMRWDLAKGDFSFKSKDNEGKDIDIYKYAGKQSIIDECENSLRRLGTDYIDLYQIHWPESTTSIQESMETVAQLIKEGKVRYAGVCNYNAAQLEEACKYVNIVSNQIGYSMVKRKIEEEVVPYCIENNLSILAYSPLERGLLSGKMTEGYKFEAGDHRQSVFYFNEENLKRTNQFLDKIKHLAAAKNATLAQLVISWTLSQPGITIALVGARNEAQAKQNAQSVNVSLTAEEIAFINTHLNQLELIK